MAVIFVLSFVSGFAVSFGISQVMSIAFRPDGYGRWEWFKMGFTR